jgi:hypothetical protein
MADLVCCLLQLFKLGVELPLKVVHRDSAATGRGLPAYVSIFLKAVSSTVICKSHMPSCWTIVSYAILSSDSLLAVMQDCSVLDM